MRSNPLHRHPWLRGPWPAALLFCALGASPALRADEPQPVPHDVAEAAAVAPQPPSSVPEPEPSGVVTRMEALLRNALAHVGLPYRAGGSSPSTGFDCSGFVRYLAGQSLGIVLPRTAGEMAGQGLRVDRKDLQPGDLVFFNTRGRPNSHVGFYLGEGKFIHSPQRGTRVRVNDLAERYFSRRFTAARRLLTQEQGSIVTP